MGFRCEDVCGGKNRAVFCTKCDQWRREKMARQVIGKVLIHLDVYEHNTNRKTIPLNKMRTMLKVCLNDKLKEGLR